MKRSLNTFRGKILILFSCLLIGGYGHAQQNIFRSGNVVAITSTPENDNLNKLNNGNVSLSDYIDFFTSGPVVITFELAARSVMLSFQVYFYSSSYAADSVMISASNNGTQWTELDKRSADAELVSARIANTVAYKYYRFTFTGIHNNDLSPLEIMADNGVLNSSVLTISPQVQSDMASLSWTQILNAGNISLGNYEIQRSKDGTNFTPLTTVSGSTLSYADTGLIRSTSYWYMVRGLLPDDVTSPFSNVVKITTIDDSLRNAPAFTVEADPDQNNIAHLSWALTIGGQGGFDIERSVDSVNYSRIRRLEKSVNSLTDSSLANHTKYWYRIRAFNDISESPYSAVNMITTINDSLLVAPVLKAAALTGEIAELSWTQTPLSANGSASRNKQGGFQLERSTDGINFAPLGLTGQVSLHTLRYADESLLPNTSYWYRIRAFNYLGTSPYSGVIKITTGAAGGAVVDITDDGGQLFVSADNIQGADASEGSLRLIDNNIFSKWLLFNTDAANEVSAVYKPTGSYVVTAYSLTTGDDAPGRDPRNWRVEGSSDSTNWTLLDSRTGQLGGSVPRSETRRYMLAEPGTTPYKFYRITFIDNNNATDGVRYQVAEWQIFGISSVMIDVPGGLSATETTLNSIALQWSPVPTGNISKLELQRSEDGLYFQTLDMLDAGSVSFTDQGLYDSVTYFYRLRSVAKATSDVSAWSNVVKATTLFTPGLPITPNSLSLLFNNDTVVGISWNDRAYNEIGYEIERSKDSVTFMLLKTVPANTSVFNDSSVMPGMYFYYRVRAKNAQGESAYSPVLKVLVSGQNMPPEAALPVIARNLCLGSGIYHFSFTGVTAGPHYENGQKIRISNVTANASSDDTVSAKLLEQFTFDPVINNGVVNYGFNTTGLAKAGDSAMVIITIKVDGGTNSFGVDSLQVPVKFYFVPMALTISSDKDTSVPRYSLVTLTAATNFPGTTKYQWANAEGIEGVTTNLLLRVRPTRTTIYTVTATSPGGCQATASITISPQSNSIQISNVLTPNGDGKNDRWMIWGIDRKPNNTVKVFDRAGRLVYSQKNYSNNWDGRFQGKLLEEGAYYYVVDYGDGEKPTTGMLNIIHAH